MDKDMKLIQDDPICPVCCLENHWMSTMSESMTSQLYDLS